MSRRIFVGPEDQADIAEAVRIGGGELVTDSAAPEAIIWLGNDPSQLAALLTSSVKWVQLPGAGIEGWAQSGVLDHGRVWTTAGPAYADAVAEHALALMLAAAKEIHRAARASSWVKTAPRLLRGTTILILGAGGIGRSLIRLVAPFNVNVLAVNRSGAKVQGATTTSTPDHLHELLPLADFVVLSAPDTPVTRGIVGRAELDLMAEHAWLINVARGRLIDTDALVTALDKQTIGGAALDTTYPEPLPDDHSLWRNQNVVITPHVGNPIFYPQLAALVRKNVELWIMERPLNGIIDVGAGY